ncbi:tRNA threonylcarbamoyladenosine biosynthesis protein TsaB [hydrothermal vent metagenome]|uniref:tRNA threonylcarbamoyladenosine biosynthesis protein TsaB n=1 Tax=hydrothermal vent metagenome TaxID=652676 RepID=A0A3B1DY74_9ZZZZ
MLILGIETSGREGSVALFNKGEIVDSQSLSQEGRRHAQLLVAEIDAMLQRHNFSATDCDGIAVSIGPGSFTGLRVGVVCAKTFAYATGCLLVAVDTFLAIASNAPNDIEKIEVISNAQRGELFVGKYIRNSEGNFFRTDEIEMIGTEEFIKSLSSKTTIAGSGVRLIEEEAKKQGDTLQGNILPEEYWQPQATQICLLGEQLIQQNETANPWTLAPHYIRHSAAEEKRAAEEGK